MPICPNGHGSQAGNFCQACGLALIADPPAAASDSLRIRSSEAHANVNQTFVIPTAATSASSAPSLVKCPKCGRRSSEAETFDCQGPCGREHLCPRHFDEELDLCRDCADEKRGIRQQAAARQAQIQTRLAAAEADTSRLQDELARLTCERDTLRDQIAHIQDALALAERLAAESQTRTAALETAVADWRKRAESAEEQLAEFKRREAAAAAPAALPDGNSPTATAATTASAAAPAPQPAPRPNALDRFNEEAQIRPGGRGKGSHSAEPQLHRY